MNPVSRISSYIDLKALNLSGTARYFSDNANTTLERALRDPVLWSMLQLRQVSDEVGGRILREIHRYTLNPKGQPVRIVEGIEKAGKRLGELDVTG